MTTFQDVFLRIQCLLEFILAHLGEFHREMLENLSVIKSYANFTQDLPSKSELLFDYFLKV